jgi:SpoVK/Ycf46/Vps4 family AAA+-type ATPase
MQLAQLRVRFEKICREAAARRPAVIVFDDIDKLFPVTVRYHSFI